MHGARLSDKYAFLVVQKKKCVPLNNVGWVSFISGCSMQGRQLRTSCGIIAIFDRKSVSSVNSQGPFQTHVQPGTDFPNIHAIDL